MHITAIQQQKKHQNRYSVYVDNDFAFGISENLLLQLGLYTGQEVTDAELKDFKQEAEFSKVYERALNYVSIRPRSEYEVTDYMRRKGYDTAVAESVLAKLRELELVDDAAFARSWVQWRQSVSPRSRRKLCAELQQKGISGDLIDEVLEGITEEEQIEALRSVIARKRHRYDSRQKFMAYLSRQGFSYEAIKKALEEEET